MAALQEWEGYVVEIDDEEFVARLIDLTAGHSHETAEANIPLAELSEHDVQRMEVGSIFRWTIGDERSPTGTGKRVSRIVLLDLPKMAESDFRRGEIWAQEMAQSLDP